MATQIGKGQIFGLSGATLTCSALSGYVSPLIQGGSFTHNGVDDEILDQSGEVAASICRGEHIEVEFNIIPQGSTVANAKLSAGLPTLNAAFGISGLPILPAGGFTDALNTNGANTQPWFYKGGGKWTLAADGKWMMTLPLRRYIGISSGTPIT